MTASEFLSDLLTEHCLKKSWVAEASGLARATVVNIANGKEIPGGHACACLAVGLCKLVPSLDPTWVAGRLCLLAEGVDES